MWFLIIIVLMGTSNGAGGTSSSVTTIINFHSQAACQAAADAIPKEGSVAQSSYAIIVRCAKQGQ
jgi:hypothetical protein